MSADTSHVNLVLLSGTVRGEVMSHRLATDGGTDGAARGAPGERLTFTLVGGGPGERWSTSVAIEHPTEAVVRPIVAGAELVVVGHVRQRFFRAGGATVARNEVVASAVIPRRRRRQVCNAVGSMVEALDEVRRSLGGS